jgi:hypothetical protein
MKMIGAINKVTGEKIAFGEGFAGVYKLIDFMKGKTFSEWRFFLGRFEMERQAILSEIKKGCINS